MLVHHSTQAQGPGSRHLSITLLATGKVLGAVYVPESIQAETATSQVCGGLAQALHGCLTSGRDDAVQSVAEQLKLAVET